MNRPGQGGTGSLWGGSRPESAGFQPCPHIWGGGVQACTVGQLRLLVVVVVWAGQAGGLLVLPVRASVRVATRAFVKAATEAVYTYCRVVTVLPSQPCPHSIALLYWLVPYTRHAAVVVPFVTHQQARATLVRVMLMC